MAEISRKCLASLVDMGVALGALQEGIKYGTASFVEVELEMAQNISTYLLQDCPHPPNVVSDQGAPRQFQRQLRQLREGWEARSLQSNLDQVNELREILNQWIDGMAGTPPSAWRDNKARTRVPNQRIVGANR